MNGLIMAGTYDIPGEQSEECLAATRSEQLMSRGQGVLGSLL
jgi:hypothetical protein